MLHLASDVHLFSFFEKQLQKSNYFYGYHTHKRLSQSLLARMQSEVLEQEREDCCVAMGGSSEAAEPVPLSSVHLQLVRLSQRHQPVHEERRVREQHILIVHPMQNQQTVGPGNVHQNNKLL